MSRQRARFRHDSAGQAMLEALVAMLLLAPLLLGMQALAELQFSTLQTTQLARYAGLATTLVGRARVVRSDASLAREFDIDAIANISVGRAVEPQPAARDTQRWSRALTPANRLAGAASRLETQGWVAARAQVQWPLPGFLRRLFAEDSLTPRASMVLLTEDGAAVGRAEVAQRVRALDAMRPMNRALVRVRPLLFPLSIVDPSITSLCTVGPDPDLLPTDRLVGAAGAAVIRQGCP